MSDDKELADRVVAFGVGSSRWDDASECDLYGVAGYGLEHLLPSEFTRSARVAMAMMERCRYLNICHYPESYIVEAYPEPGWPQAPKAKHAASSDSLPRAIIECCCLALESKGAA